MASEKIKSRIDMITNILTIIVALGLIVLFIQRYLVANVDGPLEPVVGEVASIPDFDPSGNGKNVLLVMMKGCRFCEESMGFYKTLLAQRPLLGTDFMAVFPHDTEETKTYIAAYGLGHINVKHARLAELNVGSTPTIIVTDSRGVILRVWIGKLSEEREREVLSFIRA